MTDSKTIVTALRCSSTPGKVCDHECVYCAWEEVQDGIPMPPDEIRNGKKYWCACDCDRIALDAAFVLERLMYDFGKLSLDVLTCLDAIEGKD